MNNTYIITFMKKKKNTFISISENISTFSIVCILIIKFNIFMNIIE